MTLTRKSTLQYELETTNIKEFALVYNGAIQLRTSTDDDTVDKIDLSDDKDRLRTGQTNIYVVGISSNHSAVDACIICYHKCENGDKVITNIGKDSLNFQTADKTRGYSMQYSSMQHILNPPVDDQTVIYS